MNLQQTQKVIIYQRKELAELFGFETRNKYEIFDENKNLIGFCAEQQKGVLGFIFRQFIGHWRSFEVHFFNQQRQTVFKSIHPFRFFFQEFEVLDSSNKSIGLIKQRFGIVKKKWSGFLKEMFLDADNFLIEYQDNSLSQNERLLILAASVFTDLQYFERKAEGNF